MQLNLSYLRPENLYSAFLSLARGNWRNAKTLTGASACVLGSLGYLAIYQWLPPELPTNNPTGPLPQIDFKVSDQCAALTKLCLNPLLVSGNYCQNISSSSYSTDFCTQQLQLLTETRDWLEEMQEKKEVNEKKRDDFIGKKTENIRTLEGEKKSLGETAQEIADETERVNQTSQETNAIIKSYGYLARVVLLKEKLTYTTDTKEKEFINRLLKKLTEKKCSKIDLENNQAELERIMTLDSDCFPNRILLNRSDNEGLPEPFCEEGKKAARELLARYADSPNKRSQLPLDIRPLADEAFRKVSEALYAFKILCTPVTQNVS